MLREREKKKEKKREEEKTMVRSGDNKVRGNNRFKWERGHELCRQGGGVSFINGPTGGKTDGLGVVGHNEK